MEIQRGLSWKLVQKAPKLQKKCPRCNNQVEFTLAWDGEKTLFGFGWWAWRVAAYCCPICPFYEKVSIESVKNYLE